MTRQACYTSTGHGSYVDFFARPATSGPELRSSGPGLRLDTTTGEWSTIAPGPNLQSDLGAIHWTNGLAVLQELGQFMVYRP